MRGHASGLDDKSKNDFTRIDILNRRLGSRYIPERLIALGGAYLQTRDFSLLRNATRLARETAKCFYHLFDGQCRHPKRVGSQSLKGATNKPATSAALHSRLFLHIRTLLPPIL